MLTWPIQWKTGNELLFHTTWNRCSGTQQILPLWRVPILAFQSCSSMPQIMGSTEYKPLSIAAPLSWTGRITTWINTSVQALHLTSAGNLPWVKQNCYFDLQGWHLPAAVTPPGGISGCYFDRYLYRLAPVYSSHSVLGKSELLLWRISEQGWYLSTTVTRLDIANDTYMDVLLYLYL